MAVIKHMIPLALLLAQPALAQSLNGDQLGDVKQRLQESSMNSWELGARAQALLESDSPDYSVLTSGASIPPSSKASSSLNDVFNISKTVVGNRSNSNRGAVGAQPLMADGSAADPASVGVAVLLSNWTGQGSEDNLDYAGAAEDQLYFLYHNVPHTDDGAMSHRTEEVQLWSDFVYMVPPFLAYYGALTNNRTILQESYNQIRLYRQYLRDNGGLWRHVVLGPNTDSGHWSTGNAWAAAGMLRVLGTIVNSQFADSFWNQRNDLILWISEIHGAMYGRMRPSGLFLNYVDDSSSFEDAASSALLASTVYRLALLTNLHTYIPQADKARQALFASNDTALVHFTKDMWLTPVVNPYNIGSEGSESPEAQAFVVQLDAAYRDWKKAGSPGASSGAAVVRAGGWLLAVLPVVALMIL